MDIRHMVMAGVIGMATCTAQAEDARGYWNGAIGNSLNVIVRFNTTAEGRWEATMSVPKQNLETAVEDLVVTPEQISFALPRFRASYLARWNSQENAWVGTWSQGKGSPLVLRRVDAQALEALKPKRPQEAAIAARASTYASSEVLFSNAATQVKLAGTFTVPQGKGPFPAVVLVHGSGSLDRDSEVFGHKSFLVLADHLSRQGIAVLRYDKRGIAKSSGSYKGATMFDLADDAEAAIAFLRARAEVDPGKIGVLGHSEGGLIAPLLASRNPAVAFVVTLAAPGVRGDILLAEQLALTAKARGVPADAIAKERALNQALFAAMVSEPMLENAKQKASLVMDAAERDGVVPVGRGKVLIERFATPWFHTMLSYDPAPALNATRQPILALNGALDLQVPAAMDLPAIRSALSGNPRAIVKELPSLNHLFQTAKTGSIAEYGVVEETIAPVALETISDWIRATIK